MINGTTKAAVSESKAYRTETRTNQHSISLLVNNKPGVLIRISLVFARRGYNIDSLVVSPTHNGKFARMNIVASGEPKTLEQIIRQLNKLIDVIHAKDHTGETVVEKELALIKVRCAPEKRTEVLQIAEHFKGQAVDLSESTILIQATGGTEKLDALETMLDKYGIVELARTGKVIMARGESGT
ncbi:MAG TPA: acetolactate synthase small subunit [Fibrobacteres bacterium]|jgi:acetolactate synthase-1/3 small subunit|nr:acetolactate synthase small subunit [Fibrobacterota bacterium]